MKRIELAAGWGQISRGAALTLSIILGLSGLKAVAETAEKAAEGPVSDDVRRWVADLGSDQYAVREEATERLIDAGRYAIADLAAAARGDDLEVTARAITILGASLRSEDDLTEDAAVDSLMKVADARVSASADMANDALGKIQGARRDRAIAALQRLGAIVVQPNENDLNQFGYIPAMFNGPQISFGGRWHGDRSKLALLKRIPDLQRVSFYGVSLVEDDLPLLSGFSDLKQIDLFGCKLSGEAVQKLAREYPKTTVNVHAGTAKLGVAANSVGNETVCMISTVEPHSAADQAGLIAGDLILKFGDQPISDFKTLTAVIGARQAGEKVTIEVRRNSETFKKEVTLGSWR